MPVVLISGGTGLIGSRLTHHLIERGYDIIILTQQKNRLAENSKITYSYWNVEKEIIDKKAVLSADHIVHLAGAGADQKRGGTADIV